MSAFDDVQRLAEGTVPFTDSLGTERLPAEVVAQEVVGMVWLTTDSQDPRSGVMGFAVNLGGRENPDLTPEEGEYVASTFETAAKFIRKIAGAPLVADLAGPPAPEFPVEPDVRPWRPSHD